MKIYEVETRYRVAGSIDIKAISTSADAAMYLEGAFEKNPNQESFYVILLNSANRPMARVQVTIGLVNQTLTHPREVFRTAIREGASSVILAHNHPSGSTVPSREDINTTQILTEAGKILDIPVLDHIIIGDAWHSMRSSHPQIFT